MNFFQNSFEGMFYDMSFWPHPCNCESCKEWWEKECGGDFVLFLTDETGKLLPDVSIDLSNRDLSFESTLDNIKSMWQDLNLRPRNLEPRALPN